MNNQRKILLSFSFFLATQASLISNALAQPTNTSSSYGLGSLLFEGNIIAIFTTLLLLAMSIYSWYIFVLKYKEQKKISNGLTTIQSDFWEMLAKNDLPQNSDASNPFYYIAKSGVQAKKEYKGELAKNIPFNVWLEISMASPFDEIQEKLAEGLNFLATIGATAPFVGLFGTVWGIYHALTAIGTHGQASIEIIAGPIGEALIMTGLGLAVAVPAVFGYNWLQKRNRTAIDSLHRFSSKVEKILLGGSNN